MKKYIFIDCDGTLTTDGITIPESAKKALKQAKNNGHEIILTTGRYPDEIDDEIRSCDFDGYILCSGKLIHYHDTDLDASIIDQVQVKTIVDYCESHNLLYRLETTQGIIQSSDFQTIFDKSFNFGENSQEPYTELSSYNHYPTNAISIYAVIYQENYLQLQELSTLKSEVYAIGMNQYMAIFELDGVNKGTAISKLMELYNIDKKDTISIGDDYNDCYMFKQTQLSVAVGLNSPLARFSTHLMDDPNNDGLYNLFQQLSLI